MAYPPLTRQWTFPSIHEREIYKTIVYEIFYERILFWFFISSFIAFSLNYLQNTDYFIGFIFFIIIFTAIFFLFMPIFIKPWDIVLSNKRFILRHRYWFSGRFTTVKTLFLLQLESENVTPRIKVGSLLLGFFILQTFSVVLIEYGFTLNLPLPLFIGLFFVIGRLFGITNQFESDIKDLVELLFSPFLEFALLFGFISLFISLGLIIFSLPYRKVMQLQTTGGHRLQLNAGIPADLSNLVYAASRKHKVLTKQETKFKWDMPLLEDEEIRSYGRVGLIDRKVQILSILSLLIVFQSIDLFLNLITSTNNTSFLSFIIIFFVNLFNLTTIILSILFSKRYHRIIATNHRLLFQEERNNVSGLWGKRVYKYSDLQKKHLQGYKVERFTGMTFTSIVIVIMLILFTIFLYNFSKSYVLLLISALITILYVIYSYKAYTRLEFQAISGFAHILNYQLPLILERIAHKIEDVDWIYNLIFANILTEKDIVQLCNDIRDNQIPVKTIDERKGESISEDHFLNLEEPKLHRWQKIGPAPYIRIGIILGFLSAFIAILFIYPILDSSSQIPFFLLSMILLTIISLRRLILFTYTLIITPNRVFLVKQKIPRTIAKFFGVLPEWALHEVRKDQILSTQFRFLVPRGNIIKFLFNSIIFTGLSISILKFDYFQIYISSEIIIIILFLISILFVLLLPIWISQFISLIPRFSLLIFTRFDFMFMPYFKKLKTFSNVLGEQFDIYVENDQIFRK